jgi:Ohr subfamily peroxiredoxin
MAIVTQERTLMPVDVKYRTTATAIGGRDGQARTIDGSFAIKLSTPKELGGAGGDGANPEQLFAADYSACFIGALKVAGQQLKLKVPAEARVTATVGISPRAEGGSASPPTDALSCPALTAQPRRNWSRPHTRSVRNSNATRGNVDVGLTVV